MHKGELANINPPRITTEPIFNIMTVGIKLHNMDNIR